THISQPSGSAADEGTGSKPEVPEVPTDESEEELSWNSTDAEGDENKEQADDDDEEDEGDDGEEGNGDDNDDEDGDGEEGDDDDVDQEVVRDDDKDDDEEVGMMNMNLMKKQGKRKALVLSHKPLKIVKMKGRGLQGTLEVEDTHVTLTPVKPDGMESIFETTSRIDVQTPTSVAHLPITTPTMTSSTIATITTTTSQAPILPTTVPSDIIQHLPSFGSLFRFDDRLRSLEENFSEVMQTNQFVGAVSVIPEIVQHYIDQRMNEAVKVVIQIQSDRLREEAQRENDEFLRTVDENINKIIKEQVKEQVKAQVSKILPRIKHVILIEKMEGNKSIQRSDEQRNLYKALVNAYESDKIILDTYRETVTLKRRRDDDEDKDEEPFAGPDRGSKRRREGKEPESASAPLETATKSAGRSTTGSRSRQASASEFAFAEEPVHTTFQMEEPSHPEFDTVDTLTPELLAGPIYDLMKGSCKSLMELEYHLEEVYKATTDQLDWVNPEGQQYPHNLLQPLPLIPDNRGRRVIPFAHFINNDLEYLRGGASSRKYTTSVTKTKAAYYRHIKWIEDLVPRTMWIQEPIDYDKHALWGVSHWGRKRQQFYGFAVNQESARDVYSKRRIIAITELKIVEWHSYKHLDWIRVRRDDDKLYKFKEGDYKRLRIQDIEDMLLLLVQGKLTNLTVEECFAFNVSLRMFTRSIVIQRRVEDL
nr:hypothetical protein [Tanacetum cinerariifolium]